jgi:LuxR family maltose regulon positive regulatory protein
LTEIRGVDLRFTPDEAAAFLNEVMNLGLALEEIAALDARTEGWIAGLQLAALSLQGHPDVAGFIASFAGSHHFVLDYLLEEVLRRQPDSVQDFLLRTSILDRLCGPLCDALLLDATTPAQETLEYLDRANLFIVSLDDKRRWYRYHRLFADLLRQRRQQIAPSSGGTDGDHLRASAWYEANGFEIEAFEHAAAGHDVERAERLIEGRGMPLHFRGALAPILHWLSSLPTTVLDARPGLWITYASVLLGSGRTDVIEPKLQAAERALRDAGRNDQTRDLLGRIASTRATLAVSQLHVETIIAQSRRALEYLDPDNLPFRTSAVFKLGFAHQLQGDRAEARRAYDQALTMSRASGNTMSEVLASIGVGVSQETDNQLYLALETYRHAMELAAGLSQPVVCEAELGLARVLYQWNDLDAAEEHGERSLRLALQTGTDRPVVCEVFLARLALARADVTRAGTLLADADRSARQHGYVLQMPEIAAAQVLVLLRQGDVAAAALVAGAHELPLSQARVHLAQGDPTAALAVLEPYRRRMAEKAWADEELKAVVLLAVAFQAHGEHVKAAQLLDEALALAEPGGFIRIFADEGGPMARLLYDACSRGAHQGYVRQVLAAFHVDATDEGPSLTSPAAGTRLAEPLSARELEVLALIAKGLTNQEIAARLYLSLHTVKAHARNIYAKLGVSSRTQAAAKGRALGLLAPGRNPDG